MDIRTVESIVTSGALGDSSYRINSGTENISLSYDNDDGSLVVVDNNLNYANLPHQLGSGLVKKVFLTYNNKSCETGKLLETVVMESGDTIEPTGNQLPGYIDSNEWKYSPSTWKPYDQLPTMTNPYDWSTFPYDVREGYTVVKNFLTAQANLPAGTPMYTAFHRFPYQTDFEMANVASNKIYTDGWYTSYVMAVKDWTLAHSGTIAQGMIIYDTILGEFLLNLTGTSTLLSSEGAPDPTEWKISPSFDEWINFMSSTPGPALPTDGIYYIETQHLVTADLNKSILKELQKVCSCCTKPDFGVSNISEWMRLTQKRIAAWEMFNQELFMDAQCIIESARLSCNSCNL